MTDFWTAISAILSIDLIVFLFVAALAVQWDADRKMKQRSKEAEVNALAA